MKAIRSLKFAIGANPRLIPGPRVQARRNGVRSAADDPAYFGQSSSSSRMRMTRVRLPPAYFSICTRMG
jgi:hypothetical protein